MSNQPLNWNILFENGSIVDLNTSIWAARTAIKLSDLGIQDSEDVQKVLSLGCHRLAPKKSFEKVREAAAAAKRSIENHSINFSMIRGARYVPDKAIPKLLEELKTHGAAFSAARAEFLASYEQIKAEQMPVIQRALQNASPTPEIAQNAYLRVCSEYPSIEDVTARFDLTWSVYAIQGAKSKDAMDAIKTETDSVKDVVKDMIAQLRNELRDKLSDLLALTERGGTLKKVSLEAANTLLDRLDSMNILGDKVLADQVKAMRTAIATVNRDEVSQGFKDGLSGIKKELESSIEQAVAEAEATLTSVGKRKMVS